LENRKCFGAKCNLLAIEEQAPAIEIENVTIDLQTAAPHWRCGLDIPESYRPAMHLEPHVPVLEKRPVGYGKIAP
jgi:hypothetical protein